jgi:uncharacterized lipoprotein YbaY
MKHPTHRRTVLMAGVAALAAATGTVSAQSTDIRGAVSFAGDKAIPEGQIKIYLEDPAIQNSTQRRVAETRVTSDGGSKTIDFSFAQPNGATVSPTLQIVARLERVDGWLVARGSAAVTANGSVSITLKEAVY